jgi:hypothetical protein
MMLREALLVPLAAMPLLIQLREDQKREVRTPARIIGLEAAASQIQEASDAPENRPPQTEWAGRIGEVSA